MDGTSPAISLRAVVTAVLALAALLAAGVLTLGLGGGASAAAQAASGDCSIDTFAYDAAEERRQRAFEQRLTSSGATLPEPGFYAESPDRTATLHAVSHNYVVILYRPGADTAPLRRLASDAAALQAPVIIAPGEQDEALVAMSGHLQLTCPSGGADAARSFAGDFYSGL
jgi:hypothetical protein